MRSATPSTSALRIAVILTVLLATVAARGSTVIVSGPISLTPAEQTVFSHAQSGLAQWQADKQASSQRYQSVLDPLSPSLSRSVRDALSDRNFQFTGTAPYLYYTRLNPILPPGQTKPDSNNRDVVREQLTVTAP